MFIYNDWEVVCMSRKKDVTKQPPFLGNRPAKNCFIGVQREAVSCTAHGKWHMRHTYGLLFCADLGELLLG